MTKKQKYIFIAVGIVVLGFVSISFNRKLYLAFNSGGPSPKKETKVVALKEVTDKLQNLPVAENPAKFSIFAQKETNKPRSQSQSDADMKKALAQTKALDVMEKENAFDGIHMTPEEYKRRLSEINERIKYYESIRKNSLGSNSQADQKLEILYRLKSTLTVLKNKIISKKNPP